MPPATTRNLTILLTDIKGFTDKTSRSTRSDILGLLEKHKELVLPVLEAKGGRLIKTIGDAFLMVFDSPTDAVLAGIAVQEALRAHNAGKSEDDRIEVRIAINSGEVNLIENDVFGEAVNITARIEALTEAGEVFFTEAVYLSMNKNEVPSSEVGLLQLKGIPEKVRVYKVKREDPVGSGAAAGRAKPAARAQASAPAAARPSLVRRTAALAIDGLLVCLLVGALLHRREPEVRVRLDPKKVVRAVRSGDGSADLKIGRGGVQVTAADVKVSVGEGGVDIGDASEAVAEDSDSRAPQKGLGFAIAWFVYSLVFLRRLGGTPGGKICRLGVAQADGSPLQKKAAFYRAAFSVVSGYCLFLGYLWALWDKDGRGWHDLVAGTRVIES